MCKAQSILYLSLGGLISEKCCLKSFQLQTQGNISQGQWPASPLSSHNCSKQNGPNGHLVTSLGSSGEEIQKIMQISPLAKAVSVSQISVKRQLQFLWHLILPKSLADDRRTTDRLWKFINLQCSTGK